MNSSRESIYGALFALLSTAVDGLGFVTISRRTRVWTEMQPAELSALFMTQVKEEVIGVRGQPNKFHLFVDAPLYVYAGPEPNVSAAPLLNAAIDRIEALIPYEESRVQNLGLPGVSEVRIHGTIEYAEGNLSGLGIAVVPIRIVAV